jgi:hypothetical protein
MGWLVIFLLKRNNNKGMLSVSNKVLLGRWGRLRYAIFFNLIF